MQIKINDKHALNFFMRIDVYKSVAYFVCPLKKTFSTSNLYLRLFLLITFYSEVFSESAR